MLFVEIIRIRMLLSEPPSEITGPLALPLSTDSTVRRSRPAMGLSIPWQAKQRERRIGRISLSKRICAACSFFWLASPSSEGAPASIHFRIVSISSSVSSSANAGGGMARLATFW